MLHRIPAWYQYGIQTIQGRSMTYVYVCVCHIVVVCGSYSGLYKCRGVEAVSIKQALGIPSPGEEFQVAQALAKSFFMESLRVGALQDLQVVAVGGARQPSPHKTGGEGRVKGRSPLYHKDYIFCILVLLCSPLRHLEIWSDTDHNLRHSEGLASIQIQASKLLGFAPTIRCI